jgi:hypothetical protein
LILLKNFPCYLLRKDNNFMMPRVSLGIMMNHGGRRGYIWGILKKLMTTSYF